MNIRYLDMNKIWQTKVAYLATDKTGYPTFLVKASDDEYIYYQTIMPPPYMVIKVSHKYDDHENAPFYDNGEIKVYEDTIKTDTDFISFEDLGDSWKLYVDPDKQPSATRWAVDSKSFDRAYFYQIGVGVENRSLVISKYNISEYDEKTIGQWNINFVPVEPTGYFHSLGVVNNDFAPGGLSMLVRRDPVMSDFELTDEWQTVISG